MPDLLLRVFPDPEHATEPWTWEVLALDDDTEHEVSVGGAVTREAAIAAAISVATEYVEEAGWRRAGGSSSEEQVP
jgi:hypothetical protein